MKGFIEALDPIDYSYDYISGVSVGAINASVLAMYPPGKEREAVKELEEFYFKYPIANYWNFWPWFIVEPFYKKSFLDLSKF